MAMELKYGDVVVDINLHGVIRHYRFRMDPVWGIKWLNKGGRPFRVARGYRLKSMKDYQWLDYEEDFDKPLTFKNAKKEDIFSTDPYCEGVTDRRWARRCNRNWKRQGKKRRQWDR